MSKKQRPERITYRVAALAELHEDPANVRRHGKKNVAAIRASLKRFGQVEPLVVQAGSGKVIGGNGRLSVMRELGWEECQIAEVAINDTQSTALAIALNRTGELAEWDEEGLAQMLRTLSDAGEADGLGFDDGDIRDLLGEAESDDGKEVGAVVYRLIVEGLTEESQADLLERLEAEGYSCRISMS